MRKSIVIVVWSCFLVYLQAAASLAATNATITLQGRLTDAITGDPVVDGPHPATVAIQRTDNGQFLQAYPTIETKDGYFTIDISGLPIELFECNQGATECVQIVVIAVDGQAAFPDIIMSNTGRAAVASRLNGDIQTSPSKIDIPPSDEFNPQTSTITDVGMNFTDENAQNIFELDTKIAPGHQERTFDVTATTTLSGVTTANGRLNVDANGDTDPDFTVNNIDGCKVFEQPFTLDCDGDGIGEFGVDFTGNARFFCNDDGLPDLELLNTGACNFHNAGLTCDRNNDGIADISFLNDGTCNFNCDADVTNEVVFNSTAVLCRIPVKVDGDGDGTPETYIGDYGGEFHCDPDQDFSSELAVQDNSVTVGASLTVDLNGSAYGENLSVGPTGLHYQAIGTNPSSSMDLIVNSASWDVNQDGTKELTVQDDGSGQTATSVAGGFRVNNFGSGPDQLQIVNGSTIFSSTSVNIDADGDGLLETSFSHAYSEVGGSFNVNADHAGGVDFSVTSTAGLTTVTIHGNLEVDGSKNFVQPHPTDDSKEIVYVAMESAEAGTYTRGSGRLRDGVAIIDLPEDFGLVTTDAGLTAQITPRGPIQSMLFVASVSSSQLMVKASNPADTDIPFDYMVNGVRRGFENHQVIRDRPSDTAAR